jgi:predicted DNA helicase
MLICDKCGKWSKLGYTICPYCGYVLLHNDENKSLFLDFMRSLIIRERNEEKRRIERDKIVGKIIDVTEDMITIECQIPRFEEGDVVGYIKEGKIEPLGIVLSGGRFITIALYKPLDLKEEESLEICESEVLIGYDLQLNLIEKIKKNELNEFEEKAIKHLFEISNLKNLRKAKPSDNLDVKEKFVLDDSQLEAIEYALGLEENESLIIIGPPGTGKTRVIAKIAYELYKKGERVLITSHTNRAVDNALEILPVEISLRVGRPEKVLPSIRPYLLSYKARSILGSKLEDLENKIINIKKEIHGIYQIKDEWYRIGYWKKYRDRLQDTKNRLKKLFEERNLILMEESEKLIKEAKIIGSTLIKSNLPPLDNQYFDTVLIDECSQVSITLALLGMIKAKKWILVGDHKQLLPIFQTLEDKKIQENLSAFCYMLNKYKERSLWLKWHYRSNSNIIGFSAHYIYEGKIFPVSSCKNIKLEIKEYPIEFLNPDIPIVFLHINSKESIREDGSKFNEIEANIVVKIIKILRNLGIKSENIGVITPYRAQRDYIKEILKNNEIEINTVDSFQGREKDVIIFTITSTKDMSFVEDENRLNVAFTRARRKLIVIGNANSIRKEHKILFKFLSYVKEKGGYFTNGFLN